MEKMDIKKLYDSKLKTAEEAVKVVKSGDWVDYGWSTNHPIALDAALAARKDELTDVNLRGAVTMWMPEVCKADDAGEHFTWNAWHCSGVDRKIISKGMGYFIPMRYSELPRFYRDGNAPVDVAMLQVTPMDAHGNFNFGLVTSHIADMLSVAKTIIVEVNENLPWVNGLNGAEINIADVDIVVEGNNPPVAVLGGGGEPSDIDKAVAKLIVERIPNGACLQLGIGGMPNAIGKMITESDLKDLGVHTEMYVDAFVKMAEAGKITGNKSRDKGKMVYTFALGTKKLYDFLDESKLFKGTVEKKDRSIMNVPFVTGDADLDAKFVAEAKAAGFENLKGHRTVGGMRASIYNAMPIEGVEKLVAFMKEFEAKNS